MERLSSFIKPLELRKEERKPDVYLDRLLSVVNESRGTKQYPLITYARLNLMLKKLGKSKKGWNRDIFIGNVLDASNPAKYFWWYLKQK